MQNFHIRPKIELYDQDGAAGHPRTARHDAGAEVEFGELSVFLAPAFVITVRQAWRASLRAGRTTKLGGPRRSLFRRSQPFITP
jgi:magnesium transporter